MISSLKPSASVREIECEEWQSLQTGSGLPSFGLPLAWMLRAKISLMPVWHLAQVCGTFAGLTVDAGSAAGNSVCAVWQSAHMAVTTRPLSVSPLPCTLCR